MAKTALSDIIIPSVVEKYTQERTAAKSAMVQAGIIQRLPEFDALASGGGKTVDMPFWQDITPARQIISDGSAMSVNKITATKDIAIINNDGNAWGVNDLVGMLSGADPVGAIVNLLAEYWARTDQAYVVSCLKGMFASTLSSNFHNIAAEATGSVSTATQLTGLTFVDGTAKLGDNAEKLTVVAMHSAIEAALRKQDLIVYLPASDGKSQMRTFQGRRVIVDDSLPTRAGTTSGTVYRTYLFGEGAFAYGVCPLNEPVDSGLGTKGLEWSRSALDSDTYLLNRRRYILHPRGVKFTSSSLAGTSPTNGELETSANWTRVFEAKNVRVVAIDHNA